VGGLSGNGRRRIVAGMTFSSFDKRLLAEGLAFFTQPRLASFLETLGSTKLERVEALATMLRNGSKDEFDDAVDIFERALARAFRDRDDEFDDVDRTGAEAPRRRRQESAAERRERRHRSA
jgi:hypothetical protein